MGKEKIKKRFPYTRKELIAIVFVVAWFALAQYYAVQYTSEIRALVGSDDRLVGMVVYGMVAVMAIVFAPMSSLPLIPIVATVWGSFLTTLVTIIAWTIGSGIAFLIARRYGRHIIGRVVDLGSMQRIEALIGTKELFTTTLLLRMVVPVDILSYALGLFSTIRFIPYMVATLIGIIPFTIFFAYAIQIPWVYQIGIVVVLLALVFFLLKERLGVSE